ARAVQLRFTVRAVERPANARHNGYVVRGPLAGKFAASPSSLPAEFRPQAHLHMAGHRVGLWLVGAFGGVGTAITVGLAAMATGLADRTGLVTELPEFTGLPLPDPAEFVIGGHDIRAGSFAESAEEFRLASGVFESAWLSACKDELAQATSRVRPGSHFGAGPAIAKLAD